MDSNTKEIIETLSFNIEQHFESIQIPNFGVEHSVEDPAMLVALEYHGLKLYGFQRRINNRLFDLGSLFIKDMKYFILETELYDFRNKIQDLDPVQNKALKDCLVPRLKAWVSNKIKEFEQVIELYRSVFSSKLDVKATFPLQITRDAFFSYLALVGCGDKFLCLNTNKFVPPSIEDLIDLLRANYSRHAVEHELAPTNQLISKRFIAIDLNSLNRSWLEVILLKSPIVAEIFHNDSSGMYSSISRTTDEVFPQNNISEVVLPENVKEEVVTLCQSYLKNHALGKPVALTFQFVGTSVAGKTMLAHAIADQLGRKLLTVTLSDHKEVDPSRILAFIFEVAKTNSYVVLFDECERMFFHGTSEASGWLKTLFESFSGVAIFISNYHLPYAFDRRMTYTMNFLVPNHESRQIIFKNELAAYEALHQKSFRVSEDEIRDLLRKYDVAPGYYKHILHLAASLSGSNVSLQSLEQAFRSRSTFLKGEGPDSEEEATECHFSDLYFEKELATEVDRMRAAAKKIISKEKDYLPNGLVAVFEGISGTGKTALATALAKELGLNLEKHSGSSFLGPFVGETEKAIRSILCAKGTEQRLILIDEADSLFASRDRAVKNWEISRTNEFLRALDEFRGILILTTNRFDLFDSAFHRRILYRLSFGLPDLNTRFKLWQRWQSILEVSQEDLAMLAEKFILTGAEIKSIVVRAELENRRGIDSLIRACRIFHDSRSKGNREIKIP